MFKSYFMNIPIILLKLFSERLLHNQKETYIVLGTYFFIINNIPIR